MSETPISISGHYTSGTLWDRLIAALTEDGIDAKTPTIETLAPYDHFHGRGLEATKEISNKVTIAPDDCILDVGCGIGGPARFFADKFRCQVFGLDLTEEFCNVAVRLNRLLALEDQVVIKQGNALSMPFPDQRFDGAYSMNVSMNIEDTAALYQELYRVLKPGGWLVLSELAQGPNGKPDYPTPWAKTPASSFLATPDQTRTTLEANGFTVESMQDTVAETLAFGARIREMVALGQKSPHRAVTLIHGEIAPQAMANTAQAIRQGSLIPIEVYCSRQH